ncbi:IS110 family transposase [Nonomuraea typhae]|uniref:IS110 family transposase n=1 Tax=Nonomuraea typhae TaxID=2603600 RepID=UPI003CCCDC76
MHGRPEIGRVADNRSLLTWVRGFGPVGQAGVECTGSYGAALTCHLRQAGIQVVEVNQPDKATRRRRGKTDAVDAEAAARAVLSERATAVPKSGDGHVALSGTWGQHCGCRKSIHLL